jgi:hypothetical protein
VEQLEGQARWVVHKRGLLAVGPNGSQAAAAVETFLPSDKPTARQRLEVRD